MICHKDMTFCSLYKDCKQKDVCHRPLTDEVIYLATLPIAQYTSKPMCHEPINPKQEESEQKNQDHWFDANLRCILGTEVELVKKGLKEKIDRKMLSDWILKNL